MIVIKAGRVQEDLAYIGRLEAARLLGELVEAHRRLGISQKLLAERTQMPTETVRRWLAGIKPPQLKNLVKLGDALGRDLALADLGSGQVRRGEADLRGLMAVFGAERRMRGMTQAEVERLTGMSQWSVAACERGDESPSTEMLAVWADALACRLVWRLRAPKPPVTAPFSAAGLRPVWVAEFTKRLKRSEMPTKELAELLGVSGPAAVKLKYHMVEPGLELLRAAGRVFGLELVVATSVGSSCDLAKALLAQRSRSGMEARAVAAELGVPASRFGRMESGDVVPSPLELTRWAVAVGAQVAWREEI